MLSQQLTRLIRKLKKSEHSVDAGIPASALLSVILRRLFWSLRGLVKLLVLQRKLGVVFMGPGVSLRNASMIRFGRGVTIERGVTIDGLSTDGVEIGDDVTIGPYCVIRASLLSHLGKGFHLGKHSALDAFSFVGASGGVWVGDRVIMGQHISFHAESHNFELLDRPIRDQGVTNKGIVIDDDVWVGSNVTFLDGVHVGTGCVIGAGAVVTKDLPPYSVAAGVPARVIDNRRQPKKQTPYAESDGLPLPGPVKTGPVKI
jgi:acetyltransferase-like isoleucine patch superfamily enzyme